MVTNDKIIKIREALRFVLKGQVTFRRKKITEDRSL